MLLNLLVFTTELLVNGRIRILLKTYAYFWLITGVRNCNERKTENSRIQTKTSKS
jgi:hypothetical protein